ncbi:MAG: hypothetical protein HY261_04235, partial [Chloroflexi bacterium]|nr:hypothetical protein [Chloroflexota bacterium]
MPKMHIISSDSHVVEPADLWLRHIEPKFRDRAPHLVRGEQRDEFVCDGAGLVEVALMSSGGRVQDPTWNVDTARWDKDVRPGGYNPHKRLADMKLDSLDAEVLYPTVALRMFSVADQPYRRACLKAYNTWLSEEYVKPYPKILKGIALLDLDDIDWSVKDVYRTKKLGLSGAMIPIAPKDRRFQTHHFDPVWTAAEEV